MARANNIGIDWLEVIAAPEVQRLGMLPCIHPVDTDGQTCYGVRIESQWLVGRDTAVMFDTTLAAKRFLNMVGITEIQSDEATEKTAGVPSVNCRTAQQCFHLTSLGGLGICPRKRLWPWQGEASTGLPLPREGALHEALQPNA